MMEIEITREQAIRLAPLMDSADYEYVLNAMLDHDHKSLEKENNSDEVFRIQGDCRRLRRLLDFRKFLIQSVRQDGKPQTKD